MSLKLGIAELLEWQKTYDLDLPQSDRGLSKRAEREEWEYEIVKGKGGPAGEKKIYTLPSYIIEELKEKGLLDTLRTSPSQPTVHKKKPAPRSPSAGIPDFMQPMVVGYKEWAAEQSPEEIVPIRYHVNVFGSAGNGYLMDEAPETQAMWFRRSFFDYLAVPPAQCFCTRVKGDSMHPTLIDRGTVLWRMQSRYTQTGIYLFRQVHELRIKRLQQINSYTFAIISDNSNKDIYPTETLDLSKLESYEFEIYGRYLWDCSIKP